MDVLIKLDLTQSGSEDVCHVLRFLGAEQTAAGVFFDNVKKSVTNSKDVGVV